MGYELELEGNFLTEDSAKVHAFRSFDDYWYHALCRIQNRLNNADTLYHGDYFVENPMVVCRELWRGMGVSAGIVKDGEEEHKMVDLLKSHEAGSTQISWSTRPSEKEWVRTHGFAAFAPKKKEEA